MSQEDLSYTSSSLDRFLPNTANHIRDAAGESISSPTRSVGPPRKRAPLASVACQDCRRRKTKCDGKKPACGNCAKRGAQLCTYDLEPNQSRVAAYKQKIEQQMFAIKVLEEEIQRLKQTPSRPEGLVRASVPDPPVSSSSSPSGGVPMRLLLNPAPEPNHFPHQTSTGSRQPAFEQVLPPTIQNASRETELLSQQRNLELENRTLKELILLLNSVDNRKIAQQMAEEINVHGISDNLLARAQHLFALQA